MKNDQNNTGLQQWRKPCQQEELTTGQKETVKTQEKMWHQEQTAVKVNPQNKTGNKKIEQKDPKRHKNPSLVIESKESWQNTPKYLLEAVESFYCISGGEGEDVQADKRK